MAPAQRHRTTSVPPQVRPRRRDETARVSPAMDAAGTSESRGMPRVDLRALAAGLIVGQVLLLLLTNGSLDLANAAFGTSGDRADGGIIGTASLLSVLVGGLVAARIAGRGGVWQGVMVGIGFIVIAIAFDFLLEARIVHDTFTASGGPRSLVDLGPMRIDQVISGDLLALFGGSIGGWLARRP